MLRGDLEHATLERDTAREETIEALGLAVEMHTIAQRLLAALDRTPSHMPFEDVIAVSNARERLAELAQ